MCDQTEVTYKDGDVVWVKMGPIWWPGVVKDVDKDGSGKELLAGLRSKPIAVVQFFDEDTYEFVKNLDNIYHYNCRRKDEFIKKGLEKFRKGASHMKKFPDDVKKAQKLLNEDENIIDSPKFAPVEKINYTEVFGGATPKKKAKKEELQLRSKILPLKKRLSAPPPGVRYQGKNTCPFCEFSIDTLDILYSHIRYNHTSERVDYSVPGRTRPQSPIEPKRRHTTVPKQRKKATPKKEKTPRKPKAKVKEEYEEDDEIEEDDEEDEDDEEFVPPKKEKVKSTPTPAKTPSKSEKPSEKKKRYTDVLLADWSEDDQNHDEEDDEVEEQEKPKTDLNENTSNAEVIKKVEIKTEEKKKPVQQAVKKEPPSCFDFDEEDDGFIGMSNANTYGRKIPRVIPVQDKPELGMDPEIEELFKRKPESEQEEESPPPPPKRKRGRPPKNSKPLHQQPKASPKAAEETLAATRERRPGALKTYVGEIIEKVNLSDEIDDGPPKPISRRKQDLKRQSMLEFDEAEAVALARRLAKTDSDYKPPLHVRKKRDPEIEAQKKRLSDFENLELKTEALLAEKTEHLDETALNEEDDEEMNATVEYLEDEPEPVLPTTPAKSLPSASPIQKWKEDIRLAMDGDGVVKKSIIPQWKQGIQDAMKTNKDSQHFKKIVFGGKNLEPGSSNLVKVSKLTNKGNNTLVIVPESRKFINKQQQVVLVSKQASPSKPMVVTNKPTVATKVATQPFLKLISDGNGGTKKVVSQKVVQIGSKASPSTFVLAGGKRESGIHVMRNFNGTGKTFILGGSGGKTVYRRISKPQTSGTSPAGVKATQCFIKTGKSPMPQYKTVRVISADKAGQAVSPQKRQYIIRAPEPQTIKIAQPEPEPVVQQQVVEVPQHTPQQVVAMQNQEGQTYMFVTVDSSGNLQQLDPSLLNYDVQSEAAQSQLYDTATDDLTPTYATAGQDILAEALANTNVLESEMPLTSLIMPSIDGQTVIPDNSGLLTAPLVQETSVTLQKPIMSPVEVPTSVVANTSGLQPPPLPPTPTEEDVLLEEADSGLMISEHDQQQAAQQQQQVHEIQNQVIEASEEFFIDDSQGEANTFQSMPLLTEDATPTEEPIGEQQYVEAEQHEFVSSTTDSNLQEHVVVQEELSKFDESGLPVVDGPEIFNTADSGQFIYVSVADQSSQDVVMTATADDACNATNQPQEL